MEPCTLAEEWRTFSLFENCCFGSNYLDFDAFYTDWQNRMQEAVNAGLEYSDTMLAFILIKKSKMSDSAQNQLIDALMIQFEPEINLLHVTTDLINKHYQQKGASAKMDQQNSIKNNKSKFYLTRSTEKLDSPSEERVVGQPQNGKSGQNPDTKSDICKMDSDNVRGESATTCSLCGQGFKQRGYLDIHIKFCTFQNTLTQPIKDDNNLNHELFIKEEPIVGIEEGYEVEGEDGYDMEDEEDEEEDEEQGFENEFDPVFSPDFNNCSSTKKKSWVGRKYFCDKCELWFTTKNHLEVHMTTQKHLGSKKEFEECDFRCDQCQRGFHSKGSLELHRKTKKHLGIERDYTEFEFQCDQCRKGFNTKYHLEKHLNTLKHQRGGMEPGDLCGNDSLDESFQGLKVYRCDPCQKVYTTRSNLEVHLKSKKHLGARDYEDCEFKCDKCRKGFSTKWQLEQHLNTKRHLGEAGEISFQVTDDDGNIVNSTREPKFRCDQCRKGFISQVHLEKHLKTPLHLRGGVPDDFPCDLCDKVFKQKVHLKNHKESGVHTKGKQFSCVVCGKMFQLSKSLYAHMKNHGNDH